MPDLSNRPDLFKADFSPMTGGFRTGENAKTLRGSVVPRVLPQMLLLALFSSGVVLVYQYHTFELPEFSLTPFTLLGIALPLFLGFRNNAAYDRWWEVRSG